MRFFNRSLFGLVLLALTASLLGAAGYVFLQAKSEQEARNNQQRPQRERTFSVDAIPLQFSQVAPVITAFGEIQSGRTLELRTASGGELVELSQNFLEGGAVSKGELLFQTDPASAQASLALSETELREAQFEVSEAEEALVLSIDELNAANRQFDLRKQALERQKSLRTRGVGTEAALETAELSASSAETAALGKRQSVANAKARINRAETGLARRQINFDEAQRQLDALSVYAEFDGVLSEVSGVAGGLVNANERLGQLIDPTSLEVAFRISSEQFANISSANGGLNAAEVSVKFTGLSKTLSAQIARSSAAVGEGLTGREIFARLSSDGITSVRPGDFVTVSVTEPPLQQVALIPASASTSSGEVLVIAEDNRLQAAKVQILRKQGDEILISAPDLVGKSIVKTRAPQLGEGIRVEPRQGDAILQKKEMVKLTPEMQAQLSEAVKNGRMPEAAKKRVLESIAKGELPKDRFDRLSNLPVGPDAVAQNGEMIKLSDDQKQKITIFVSSSENMPSDVKERILASVAAGEMSRSSFDRITKNMGG